MLVYELSPSIVFSLTHFFCRIVLLKVELHSQTIVTFTYHIVAYLSDKFLNFLDINTLEIHETEIKTAAEEGISFTSAYLLVVHIRLSSQFHLHVHFQCLVLSWWVVLQTVCCLVHARHLLRSLGRLLSVVLCPT